MLYVSTYPDGIAIVDLKTGVATPLRRPDNLCLAAIDGLYFRRGALIAIQNGFMTPRVVRLVLTPGSSPARWNGSKSWSGATRFLRALTTGAIVGDAFFYMANIQDDKKNRVQPNQYLESSPVAAPASGLQSADRQRTIRFRQREKNRFAPLHCRLHSGIESHPVENG